MALIHELMRDRLHLINKSLEYTFLTGMLKEGFYVN